MSDHAIPSSARRDASAEQKASQQQEQVDYTSDVAKENGAPRFAMTGLFVLAIFYALYVARDVLLPLVLAALLTLVLTPVMRVLVRARIPRAIGAAMVVAGLLGALGAGVTLLLGPATEWVAKAPETLSQVERKLWTLKRSVEEVTKAAEKVEKMASVDDPSKKQAARVAQPPLLNRFLAGTQKVLILAAPTVVLLYFLLAAGDLFLRKLVRVMPTLADKKRAVAAADTVQGEMAGYLFTITCINAGLGLVTGVALYLLDMPNPALWGVMVAIFNYVPYLGPFASVSILTVVALISFEDPARMIAVPAGFLVLTVIEGQILTPLMTGHRLLLNPVVIFLSMLFWGWLWGIVGTLIAVPITMIFKIVCNHVEALRSIGEFLSGERIEPVEPEG
jgi:predicted PurR-regulated permease PerM